MRARVKGLQKALCDAQMSHDMLSVLTTMLRFGISVDDNDNIKPGRITMKLLSHKRI